MVAGPPRSEDRKRERAWGSIGRSRLCPRAGSQFFNVDDPAGLDDAFEQIAELINYASTMPSLSSDVTRAMCPGHSVLPIIRDCRQSPKLHAGLDQDDNYMGIARTAVRWIARSRRSASEGARAGRVTGGCELCD